MLGVIAALQSMDTLGFHLINGMVGIPALDRLMVAITDKWNFAFPMAALILVALWRGSPHTRVTVLAGCLLALASDGGAQLLKTAVFRVRPCHALPNVHLLVGCTASASFPSNHVMNVAAVATLVAARHRPLVLPALGLIVLVGFSRIYVGVHYPLDVLASVALGAGLAWLAHAVAEGLDGHRIVPGKGAADG